MIMDFEEMHKMGTDFLRNNKKNGYNKIMEKSHACNQCQKRQEPDGIPLKTCSRCKDIFYCSADCQRKQWPFHKAWCKPENEKSPSFKKFAMNLLTNTLLRVPLSICLCRELNLVNRPDLWSKPQFANIHVNIEPCDIDTLFRILVGEVSPEEILRKRNGKVRGMLQIMSAGETLFFDQDKESLKQHTEVWKTTKERLPERGRDGPIIIVDVVNQAMEGTLLSPFPVPTMILEAATNIEKMDASLAMIGVREQIARDYSTIDLLNAINSAIRLDTKNNFRLRRFANIGDLKIISNLGKNQLGQWERMLEVKILSDPCYRRLVDSQGNSEDDPQGSVSY